MTVILIGYLASVCGFVTVCALVFGKRNVTGEA